MANVFLDNPSEVNTVEDLSVFLVELKNLLQQTQYTRARVPNMVWQLDPGKEVFIDTMSGAKPVLAEGPSATINLSIRLF
jgi:hypothetical protein